MPRKTKEEIAIIYQQMQEYICKALEAGDGKGTFLEDKWDRPEGGGGKTRIFQDGAIIEKGGVAFSAVHGPTPAKIIEKLAIPQADFFATGVSIVLHPFSPMVPIIHMNIRYFFMKDQVDSKRVQIEHCPTEDMWADFFTKPFKSASHFRELRKIVMNESD